MLPLLLFSGGLFLSIAVPQANSKLPVMVNENVSLGLGARIWRDRYPFLVLWELP